VLTPSTYASGLLLLILAFVCLGSWANTFKLSRWRYELYYLDFTLGAVALAVLAAFTLGTMGSDLSFADRMTVAGRLLQVYAFLAGVVFNLGNMLMVAAFGLVGISGAFLISVGVALVVSLSFHFNGANLIFLSAAIALQVIAVTLGTAAFISRARETGTKSRQQTNSKNSQKAPPASRGSRFRKGVMICVLAGLALGFAPPIAEQAMTGELGLDAYATILLFSLGLLLSTIGLNFVLMNVPVEGASVTLRNYFTGRAKQHILGWIGGILCAGGLLAALLAASVPAQSSPGEPLLYMLPVGSAILTFLWGVGAWKELKGSPGNANAFLALAAVCLAGAIALGGYGFAR
jgi:glucose uptake protein